MSPVLKTLISEDQIKTRVAELAAQIDRDYAGQELILVGVLNGAFIFLADLARRLQLPVRIDFIRLTSYGTAAVSSGEVRIMKDVELPLRDRHVLVVEDIMDSGLTLDFLRRHLLGHRPASLKICCLIDKLERQDVKVPLDYVGFTVPKGFLVGYGLDYAHQYRHCPEICELSLENADPQ